MALAVGVASKISFSGHVRQVTPSALLLGSLVRAKLLRLCIMASESTTRPTRLASLYDTLLNFPRRPNLNVR